MRELDSRHHPFREDMTFQVRSWTVERIGWAVLGLILLIALAGFFGDGRTSERTAGAPPLTVQYDRYQRLTKQTRYVVRLLGADNERQILLGPDFTDAYEIAAVEPRPLRSGSGPAGLDMRFGAAAGGEMTVVIWATPRRFGKVRLDVSSGTDIVHLRAFVYP